MVALPAAVMIEGHGKALRALASNAPGAGQRSACGHAGNLVSNILATTLTQDRLT
jgi:hypothetical protein